MNIVSVVRHSCKSILISIFILIAVIVNTQVHPKVLPNMGRESRELNFDDRNWLINTWEQWTMEQRESYLAGVQDTAEAIAFHMARGVGPKELLHSITKLFVESRNDIYRFMYGRYEPTGSGRLAHWLTREVLSVMRNKDYVYTPIYLRDDGRDNR